MKKTFTTTDVLAIVEELKNRLIGLRVNQIYNIDHQTYLIKLQKPDHKTVLLFESASRIHTTEYDWPKSPAPSSFAMKLRKHLNNKRLEDIQQLGVDRVVDLTFGSGEAMHHVIIELYDRGNVVLTDSEYIILNVLRPRVEGEETKIIVRQKYPVENARQAHVPPSTTELETALSGAKENFTLKRILNPLLDCGGSVLEHKLLQFGCPPATKRGKLTDLNLEKLHEAVTEAQSTVINRTMVTGKGYIIKKLVKRVKLDGSSEDTFLFEEFHPYLYTQHKELPFDEFLSFNKACDEFFSKLEANEVDKKFVQKEKEILKKLENVRKDHEKRLQDLKSQQEADVRIGQLIELNQQLVEGALLVVRSAIANQIDWCHIKELLNEAQARRDPIACAIRALKLESNTIILWLSDPYDCDENDMLLDSDEEREEGTESAKMRPMAVDINLDLSALANARRYYNMKRQAAKKERKTIDASFKAIKSAEKKTRQTLKEINAIANITKARKVHWFEKFFWFISSENYLAIGGRDSQQNELVVKRHMRPKDVYVHADLHGASSIIVKNPNGEAVPPKTLEEAGIMALCYSRAWQEKVVTSAWWVWGHQVSKTAPSGEYLTTGAFMVRGKKNFLPPAHLVFGFGFMFRLEESSIMRHEGERKVKVHDEQLSSCMSALERLSADSLEENEVDIPIEEDNEINGPIKEEDHEVEVPIEEDENEVDVPIKEEDNEVEVPIEEDENEVDFPIEEDDNEAKCESEDDESISKEDAQIECLSEAAEDSEEDAPEEAEISQQFPDTELQMEYLTTDQFTLKAKVNSGSESRTEKFEVSLGNDKVAVAPSVPKINRQGKNAEAKRKEKDDKEKGEKMIGNVMKRGPKGKLKKKKFKEQDEEDRELLMELLQSAGDKKKKEKKSRRRKMKGAVGPPPAQSRAPPKTPHDPHPPKPSDKVEGEKGGEPVDDETPQVADDLSILSAFTAIPLPEDELLYALPVCAPYYSMTNYKFKIKMTPGPGKKGKACKTGLQLFLNSRSTTGREKDLLRAVKEHDLGKNVPGKVKVSAPNMSKLKK